MSIAGVVTLSLSLSLGIFAIILSQNYKARLSIIGNIIVKSLNQPTWITIVKHTIEIDPSIEVEAVGYQL